MFSGGSLFWILGQALGGLVRESLAGLLTIAGVWLVLLLRPSSQFTRVNGALKTLFASMFVAQGVTLLACALYIAVQLRWAPIPAFSEGIRFFQDQRHFILLSALVPAGLCLGAFLLKKANDWRWSDLGVRRAAGSNVQAVFVVVAAIAVTEAIYFGWSHVSDTFGATAPYKGLSSETFSSVSPAWKLFCLVWFLAIGAFVEELLFRGAMLKVISQVAGIRAGLLLQAVIFAAMHDTYMNFVPIFLFGMIAGIVYIRTESIWLPAIVHSATNFLTLLGIAYQLI